MGKKRPGERSCIGCGRKADKNDLLRFVVQEERSILFDIRQQKSGRGGYLCPEERCFNTAVKKRRFTLRLKKDVDFESMVLLHDIREQICLEIKKFERFSRDLLEKKEAVLDGVSLADLQIILSTLKSQYSTICRG